MSEIPDFTAFTRSPVTRVRDGAALIMRRNQRIAKFLGATLIDNDPDPDTYDDDGRIFVLTGQYLTDAPLPYCWLSVVREERQKQIGSEVLVKSTISVSLVWDECRERLDIADQTVEDFFNEVYGTFADDQFMEKSPITKVNGRGLTDRMLETETMDYNTYESEKPNYVTLERAMLFNWETTVDVVTGQPAPPG